MRELKAKHIEKLLQVLKERGPMTTRQIEAALFLSRPAVWNRINIARREGLIHIEGHQQGESDRAYAKRLWAYGAAPDMKSEARVYREELAERKRKAEALERSRREVRPFRDPMTAAMFGGTHAAR